MASKRHRLDHPLVPLASSALRSTNSPWLSSPSYEQSAPLYSPLAFHSVTNALLENPNLNSSHLFRADIIYDSSGELKTNSEKEHICRLGELPKDSDCRAGLSVFEAHDEPRPACSFAGFELNRTVLRRLIPRKPQMDSSLLQTCHIYIESQSTMTDRATPMEGCEQVADPLSSNDQRGNLSLNKKSIACALQHLIVYQPHMDASADHDLPWYHPPLSHLAFLYTSKPNCGPGRDSRCASSLSIHFQMMRSPNTVDTIVSDRLHRTLLSLLSTYVRLTRNTPVCLDSLDGEEKAMPISAAQAIKDNIIPEHLLQTTYSRLKTTYASNLIHRWVEKTDPSKHVFEDLSITAFLIELWKKMYGNEPSDRPRFVDIACGNGVLVYCLIQEGYSGYGFDARARRTWATFPDSVTTHLHEAVCIPRPFLTALRQEEFPLRQDVSVHDGIFPAGTFIISNHADELTAWTPILAALSRPLLPLPWLAIPCCSHALSGAMHRYSSSTPKPAETRTKQSDDIPSVDEQKIAEENGQSETGDLVALRARKDLDRLSLQKGQAGKATSTYASLVRHVMTLAQELDTSLDVRQTLMRIPSTRNIGIVGGERRHILSHRSASGDPDLVDEVPQQPEGMLKELEASIQSIVHRECTQSGGLLESAKAWTRRVDHLIGTARPRPKCELTKTS